MRTPTILMLVVNVCFASINLNASEYFHQQIQDSAKVDVARRTDCNFPIEKSFTTDPDTLSNSALKKIDPVYPQAARQQGVEGLVMVKVLINPQGKVERTCAINGVELLKSAAEAAALEWEFSEFRILLKSKKADFVVSWIPFYFVLNKETLESLTQKLKGFGEIDFTQAEYGLISEIRDKQRVFIYTENPAARERIYTVLHQFSNLEIVNKPDQADYFVSYAMWQSGSLGSLPPPFDPTMSNSPIMSEDLVIFTVRDRKAERIRPRVLSWRGRTATKLPRSVKFNQTPHFITLSAFHKALAQVFSERW